MTPEERSERLNDIRERLAGLPDADVGEALSTAMSGAGVSIERLTLRVEALALAVDDINERLRHLEEA